MNEVSINTIDIDGKNFILIPKFDKIHLQSNLKSGIITL